MTETVIQDAQRLIALGFAQWDAFHLASAESARADVLLTVDDRMFKLARRSETSLSIRVDLPASWLERIGKDYRQ